jgi:hypothetical protein
VHICIDESGTFCIPTRTGPSISCVGALTIPDSAFAVAINDFKVLTKNWPRDDQGEIKGRLIRDPNQFYDYIELLRMHGCFFDCVAIDMGLHDKATVIAHRDEQARRVVSGLTARHQPSLVAQLNQIAADMTAMSPQQYVQFVAQNELINAVLQTKTLYYCQAAPAEIGNFRWRIDAKSNTRTRAEHIWRVLAAGLLEARSFREPGIALIGGDYSHFDRFKSTLTEKDVESRRAYHRLKSLPDERRGPGFDPGKILREDLEFKDSRETIELQMADVITSIAARALRGNVGRRAWWNLGQIMHHQLPRGEVIQLIAFRGQKGAWRPVPPYYDVLRHLRQTARGLLLPEGLASDPSDDTA